MNRRKVLNFNYQGDIGKLKTTVLHPVARNETRFIGFDYRQRRITVTKMYELVECEQCNCWHTH